MNWFSGLRGLALFGLLIAAMAEPALAHPGHGAGIGHGPLHYLLSLVHAPIVLVVGLAALALVMWGVRKAEPAKVE